ncbi:MAG: energy transducer TonB [Acidobacteriota bacterium]|nr:energy transducer TonB [Acidobacteriota bacterium]
MFDDLNEIGKQDGNRRAASVVMALVVEGAIIFALLVTPLIFVSILPESELLTFLIAPPTAPAPPAPPAPSREPTVVADVVQTTGKFVEPVLIPDGVILPPDDTDFQIPVVDTRVAGGPGLISSTPVTPILTTVLRDQEPHARPPAPPSSKPEPVLHISGGVQEAKAIQKIPPDYPEMARRARVEGEVVVKMLVDEEGGVTHCEVVSGHPLLRQAALEAARQWRFSPTMLSGEPVPVASEIVFRFKLK